MNRRRLLGRLGGIELVLCPAPLACQSFVFYNLSIGRSGLLFRERQEERSPRRIRGRWGWSSPQSEKFPEDPYISINGTQSTLLLRREAVASEPSELRRLDSTCLPHQGASKTPFSFLTNETGPLQSWSSTQETSCCQYKMFARSASDPLGRGGSTSHPWKRGREGGCFDLSFQSSVCRTLAPTKGVVGWHGAIVVMKSLEKLRLYC